jgi:hypothetical protein
MATSCTSAQTDSFDYDFVLTGDNVVGDKLTVQCQECTTDIFQKWVIQPRS